MFNFRCSYCDAELQGEYCHIGERVECPLCLNVQILPDPIIPQGARFQDYKIAGLLGSSLLWTTYKAEGRMKFPGKDLILRIPTTFFHKNVSSVQSFYDAVIKAGTLNMSEFPALLDRCLLEGKVYFVFEYLKNFRSIAGLARGKRLIEYHEAISIVRNVAKALAGAWSNSLILHKNLIPSNILVDENCNVKILNIGIYDFLLKDYTLIENGFSVWDCRYMSPEFISSSKSDSPACDIYSLGGILYLLLTGRHPYDGLEPQEIPTSPVPSILDAEPGCPEKLAEIAARMMSKDIQKRISNWEEIISELDAALIKLPQKRTPTMINMEIEIKERKVEPVGIKPTKYAGKKIFVMSKKDEKQNLSNTLARIVPQDICSMDKLSRMKNMEGTSRTKRKLQPGVVIGAMAAIALVLIVLFWISAKNRAQQKISGAAVSATQAEKAVKAEPRSTSVTTETPVTGTGLKSTQADAKSIVHDEAKTISQLLRKSEKILSDNPSDIDEALRLLYEAKEKALLIKDFRLEQSIIDEIFVLEERKNRPVKDLIKELASKATELAAKGDFDSAISLVSSYKGPYEKESELERKYIVENINKLKNEDLKKTSEQKKQSGETSRRDFRGVGGKNNTKRFKRTQVCHKRFA